MTIALVVLAILVLAAAGYLVHRSRAGDEMEFSGRLLRVPADYPSIQEAVQASQDGDRIVVSPGIYPENVDFGGKRIALASEDPGDPDTVMKTIIDGEGLGATVFIGRGEVGALLDGFTIRGGSGCLVTRWSVMGQVSTAGGGVFVGNGACPLIRRNRIEDNSSDLGGGVYICATSAAVLEDTHIQGNRAVLGGGLRVAGDFARRSEDHAVPRGPGGRERTLVRRCRIHDNRAHIGGGASVSRGANPELVENVFTENAARWDGGGLAVWDSSLPTVRANEFCANSVGSDFGFGGGMSVINNCRLTVEDNHFSDNRAQGEMKSGGGALAVNRSRIQMSSNVARGNQAALGSNVYIWGNATVEMADDNRIDPDTVFESPSRLTSSDSRWNRR